MESNNMVITFCIISALIIIFSVLMVTTKNIFRSAFFLLFALLATAAYYFLLNADFLAVLQIFIYAGAVTVLILFVIMLTITSIKRARPTPLYQSLISFVVSTVVFFTLVMATGIFSAIEIVKKAPAGIEELGRLLFTRYLLPFELASVILLVALIGAVYLAKEEEE